MADQVCTRPDRCRPSCSRGYQPFGHPALRRRAPLGPRGGLCCVNTLRIDLCVRCGSRVRLSAILRIIVMDATAVFMGFGRALWFGKPKGPLLL